MGVEATSIHFLEALYRQYRREPSSVDPSWRCAFDLAEALAREQGTSDAGQDDALPALLAELVRDRGHLGARLDPLGRDADPSDFDRNVAAVGLPARGPGGVEPLYRASLTIETAHIDDPVMRVWARQAFEAPGPAWSRAELLRAHEKLVKGAEFEAFLGRKYPTKKRFGAEGAEALFPLLDRLLLAAARAGVEEVVVGPMHRGRTSLMGVIFGTPLPELFAKFKGAHPFPANAPCAADVPYHLGCEAEHVFEGRRLRLTLCPNPSHLEAIDPVVLGRVRARQELRPEDEAGSVLGLLFHTDAAVVGQGVVGETLQLGAVPGFATGGTIHVVVNNQIGFTTEPFEARTSRHCTGPFKAVDALIIHVNGDDPEACLAAADLAIGFRQRFARDAVIDLVCYRRNGHNELDEPRFTQPTSYRTVDRHPGVRAQFEDRLIREGLAASEEVNAVAETYTTQLQEALEAAAEWRPNRSGYPAARWEPFRPQPDPVPEPETGIAPDRLAQLLQTLATPPSGVALHPKLKRLIEQRAEAASRGVPWSLAEALAFASLVTEGVPVRLSGQDALRGTFSSRHLGVVDIETGRRVVPLADVAPGQAPITILNSPLSEYGVLGFEYGYSLERPDGLTIWEAQFGDFANGAQIIIDQFVASGEEKWLQPSGLVMLVPHGLEGQGPEHSSARPERYLQLAARENIQIANPSTPANYFHLLRRQVLRRARKPLVLLAPKTLLRLPAAQSALSEFGLGRRFAPVVSSAPAGPVRRLLLCSGKIAYELERERTARGADDVLIVRLEMLYPLPSDALSALLAGAPEAALSFVQEEPGNMGAWSWIRPRLEALAASAGHHKPRLRYVGRPESPSPAGSFHGDHERDQHVLVGAAFA